MAHVMGAAAQRGGDYLLTDWLQHANSATLMNVSVGSGNAIGTFTETGGWIKGIDITPINTPILTLRDGASTLAVFASGALGGQRFQACFFRASAEITIHKPNGTAEAGISLLVATSAKDMANAF